MDRGYHRPTRYCYDWYGEGFGTGERSDLEIKQDILDRIRNGPYEDQYDIEVDVKKRVVILTGVSKSSVAKRAAGGGRLGHGGRRGCERPDRGRGVAMPTALSPDVI